MSTIVSNPKSVAPNGLVDTSWIQPGQMSNGNRSTPTARRIRVLHCIAGFGGGGAERQLSYLSEALTKQGIEIHIAYHQGGPNLTRMQDSGATLHELRSRGNYNPLLLWQLIKLMRKIKPDFVQTWLVQMHVLGGLAANMAGIPLIVSERSSSGSHYWTWKRWCSNRIAHSAAAVVANSEGGRSHWVGRTRARLETIRNGIPFSEIDAVPPVSNDEAGLREGTQLILYAGRFDAEKNLETMLEAIGRVVAQRDSVAAVLFGEGSLREEIAHKGESYGLGSRLRVKGFNPELWSWMKRADVFVSVSLYEGSPNTVLEAAACGCPLVVSDIAQHREILGDECAYLVPAASARLIAEALLRALDDPREARRRAGEAKETVRAFSVEAAATQYLALYHALASDGSSRKVS